MLATNGGRAKPARLEKQLCGQIEIGDVSDQSLSVRFGKFSFSPFDDRPAQTHPPKRMLDGNIVDLVGDIAKFIKPIGPNDAGQLGHHADPVATGEKFEHFIFPPWIREGTIFEVHHARQIAPYHPTEMDRVGR